MGTYMYIVLSRMIFYDASQLHILTGAPVTCSYVDLLPGPSCVDHSSQHHHQSPSLSIIVTYFIKFDTISWNILHTLQIQLALHLLIKTLRLSLKAKGPCAVSTVLQESSQWPPLLLLPFSLTKPLIRRNTKFPLMTITHL